MAISNSTATQKSVEGAEVAVSVKARKNSSKVRGGTLKGVGMLTPERTFEWAGELYEAGRTRVSPVHPVCSSPAARFLVPAWEGEDSEEVRAQAVHHLGAHGVDLSRCGLHVVPTDRVWLRDSGPTGVYGARGFEWVRWAFNAWAKYDNFQRGELVARCLRTALLAKKPA